MNNQLEQIIEHFHKNCGSNSMINYDIFKGIKLSFVSLKTEDFLFTILRLTIF